MRARIAALVIVSLLAVPASAGAADYLGMGDSYSSGNGTGTATQPCTRSPDAFAPEIDPQIPGDFFFNACSGAQTGNITTSGQEGEPRQVDRLTATTEYVTLNIGGNDAGFTSILTACATGDCNDDFDEAQRFIREDLPARLNAVFAAIKARSPQTRIVLVGYPQLFEPNAGCTGAFTYSAQEKQRANDTADLLAEVERRVTRENGYSFSDPRTAFQGHAVCEDEWINGFSISEPSGSFHPKQPGHDSFGGMARTASLAAPDPTVTRGPRARIAFTSNRDGNSEVYVVNRDGQFPVNLTQSGAEDIEPAFSPDGTKIAFASNRPSGDYEIYVANTDGTGVAQLTANATDDREPSWSPNGAFITYRAVGGAPGIYSMTAAGSSPTRLTDNAADAKPEWSPDGAEIAFERSGDIYRMNSDGQGEMNLTPISTGTAGAPAWAPSGLTLAFHLTVGGNLDIYSVSVEGERNANGPDFPARGVTRLTTTAGDDRDPAYAPDSVSPQITFQSARDGNAETYSMSATGAAQTRMTSNPGADTTPNWQADSAAPDTSFTSGPAGPTSDQTPTFEFASTELGSSFTCKVDAGAATPCSSPFTTSTLSPGPHTVTVFATDPVGNADPSAATRSFTVDIAPPDTTINSGPSGVTGDGTPTFSFSSSEVGGTYECRVDAAAFAACTSPYTSPALADGLHTFDVRAIDQAGNPDPTPASSAFTVDVTGPEAAINSGPPPSTSQSSGSIAFSGPVDAASYQCSLDGVSYAACTSPFAYGPLAEGPHSFRVRALDNLGNPGPDTELLFTIDTIAPATTIDSGPAEGSTIAVPAPSFTFSSPEPGMTFECRVDSTDPGAFVPCTSPFAQSFADGAHTVEVRAVDAAGNRDATPAARTFTVDTTGPDTQITSSPPAAQRQNTVSFAFTSEPGATFQCKFDGQTFAACPVFPYTLSGQSGLDPTQGEHKFSVRAFDAVGNPDPSPAEFIFTIDSTTPTVSFTAGPGESARVKGSVSYAFTAPPAEQNPVYECQLDGTAPGGWSSCISPFTIDTDTLPEGTHTLNVRARDTVDAGPRQTRTFVVDRTKPVTIITGGPAEGSTITQTSPQFAWSSSADAVSFACTLDGAPVTPCASPRTVSLGQGPHTFTVAATDSAGNVEDPPASRAFTVDSIAPTASITAGPSGATNDPTPTFEFSANEPGSTFRCSIDNGNYGTCGSPLTLGPLGDGAHTLAVRAKDQAENEQGTPTTRNFSVDTSAPDTTITSGPSGPTASASHTFAFTSSQAGSSFECSLDGAPASACSSPLSVTGLGEGAHTFTVTSSDAAMNPDPSPATRTFTVDTTAPETTITSGPDGATGTATPSFSFTAGEASTFQCRVDSGAFSPCTSPAAVPAQGPGTHTFEVRATDALGNAEVTSATRSFTVSSAPVPGRITILTGSARATRTGVVAIKLSCAGEEACSGRLVLRTAAKVKVGSKRVKLLLGAASTRAGAGAAVAVKVRLNRRARTMLVSKGQIRARATIGSAARKLLIRPPAARRLRLPNND